MLLLCKWKCLQLEQLNFCVTVRPIQRWYTINQVIKYFFFKVTVRGIVFHPRIYIINVITTSWFVVNMYQACALELTQLNVPRKVSWAAQYVGDLSNHDASEQQKWLVHGWQNHHFIPRKVAHLLPNDHFFIANNPGEWPAHRVLLRPHCDQGRSNPRRSSVPPFWRSLTIILRYNERMEFCCCWISPWLALSKVKVCLFITRTKSKERFMWEKFDDEI